jgi:hypothetical protein
VPRYFTRRLLFLTLLAGCLAPGQQLMRSLSCTAATGSGTAYGCTISGTPSGFAYQIGTTSYRFKADVNNTGSATVNFNSLGAKTIVKIPGGVTTALAAGDLCAGQWVNLVYDGTNMQMTSPTCAAAGGGSSQWTTTGSDIYYNTGAVLIDRTTNDATHAILQGTVPVPSNWSNTMGVHFAQGTPIIGGTPAPPPIGDTFGLLYELNIPSTAANTSDAAFALAGYAATQKNAYGAVGVVGVGICRNTTTTSTNCWGMNAVAQADGSTVASALFAMEADVNTGTAGQTQQALGVWITGSNGSQTAGASAALDIGDLSISPYVPWKWGAYINDASSLVGIYVGSVGGSTSLVSVASAPIELHSYNGSGAAEKVTIFASQFGEAVIGTTSPKLYLQYNGVNGYAINTQTGSQYLVGQTLSALGAVSQFTFAYCTDCHVASPCTSGGSGAWAFGSPTQWNCPF